jgi:hypothetical protein
MIHYVLVETPVETLFEVAEKLKLKLPIEINDLHKEDTFDIWNRFACLSPTEVRKKTKRYYFTAPYSVDLHEK